MPIIFENTPMEFVSKRWEQNDVDTNETVENEDERNRDEENDDEDDVEDIVFEDVTINNRHSLFTHDHHVSPVIDDAVRYERNTGNNYDNNDVNEDDEVNVIHSLPTVEGILAMYNVNRNRFKNTIGKGHSSHMKTKFHRICDKLTTNKGLVLIVFGVASLIIIFTITGIFAGIKHVNVEEDGNIKTANNDAKSPVLITPKFDGRNAEYRAVMEYLISNDISNPDVLLDEGSYQFHAASWLANYDGANLAVPQESVDTESGYLYVARYIMALNYFALGGAADGQWNDHLNFLSAGNICTWSRNSTTPRIIRSEEDNFFTAGIFCHSDNTPAKVYLSSNGLLGRIPTENGRLTSLIALKIDRNELIGSLPSELCHLSNLVEFNAGANHISGTIPSCIGNQMGALHTLYLQRNQLTGTIPMALTGLVALQNLNLGYNMLFGEAASIFANLPNIENLIAPHNQLSGILDENFMVLSTKLVNLNLAGNLFTTTKSLPSHLFNGMPQLKVLSLSKNNLHGSIPEILTNNSTMLYLSLYDNFLSGKVTKSLSNLRALQHLDLTNNQLTGEVPTELGTMTQLKFLALGKNGFLSPAPFPTSVLNLVNLRFLSLRDTNRNSRIPLRLPSALKDLQYLDLSYNKFTGALPLGMYSLSKLEVLMLNSNKIDGVAMQPEGQWDALHVALLDGMNLSGDLNPLCEFISTERYEVLYADCDGDSPSVQCNCCKCCVPGMAGCSHDNVALLDRRLEYVYRTSDYTTSISAALQPNFPGLLCSRDGICN